MSEKEQVEAIAIEDIDSKGEMVENKPTDDQKYTDEEKQKQQLKEEGKKDNQVPMKQGMSKKKKICIGCSIFGVILLGLCIYFGYNLWKYGALLPSEYGDDDPVMKGYDVVEYFNIDASASGVKGNEKHEVKYDGAYFWFKNAANKAAFEAEPQKYVPQMGAFCTWGIQDDFESGRKKWGRNWLGPPCDPKKGWKVYKDKLYCNVNSKLRDEFFSQPEKNLAVVETLWIKWMGSLGPKAGYFNNRCFSNNPRYCESSQYDFNQGEF